MFSLSDIHLLYFVCIFESIFQSNVIVSGTFTVYKLSMLIIDSFNFLKLFDSTPNLLNKSLKLLVSLIKSYELSPNLYKILLYLCDTFRDFQTNCQSPGSTKSLLTFTFA
nr:MAG TPA: hypothetical protein [Caudoviricetes sp.]